MTDKRFEICDVDLYEYGMPLNEIIDNGVPLSQNQVCELLNELHEENQKCKEYNGILYANHTKTDRKLVKQISELKQENKELKSDMRDNYKKHKELLDKNEQLKQLIKYADELISWNTVPQCQRSWNNAKFKCSNER